MGKDLLQGNRVLCYINIQRNLALIGDLGNS